MAKTPAALESLGSDEESWVEGDHDSMLSSGLGSWPNQALGHSRVWQRIERYQERKWLREQLGDYGFSGIELHDES